MNDAFPSFIIGLLCTGALFLICLVVVVGVKTIFLAIKERLAQPVKQQAEPEKPAPKHVKKRKRKPKTVSKPVRSIEIDPDQVDRIYVKKIS